MKIFDLARQIGFDLVGVAPAMLPDQAFERYEGWVKEGNAGAMAYLERDIERRRSVREIMPSAQSVICLGVNYYPGEHDDLKKNEGRVARYAHGQDYHKVLEKMLKQLVRELREIYPKNQFKSYVDTGAVLERAYAEAAGLGKIVQNATLITPEFGSWVVLAEVITDLELPKSDLRKEKLCGECLTCLAVCPTGAFKRPQELDARKCISYLTIENRGPIPLKMRPLIGDRLFGCDGCQEICPQNVGRAQKSRHTVFTEPIAGPTYDLEAILRLKTDDEFNALFAKSPLKRAKREGLVRNACVVAANLKLGDLLPLLKNVAAHDSSEMVREHAAWAIKRLESLDD